MQPITYNIMIDTRTGQPVAMSRNGRAYSMKEVAALHEAAERGDADAAASLSALDHTGMSMEEIAHDCPECRAERERTGRAPEPIVSWTAGIDPPLEAAARDPNWWHGRRRGRQRGRRRRR
jgi:hypothetical protein